MRHGKRVTIVSVLGALGLALVVLADTPGDAMTFIERKDVRFPHEMHFANLEIECESCHHETRAETLKPPHPSYFEDFWANCETCHKPAGQSSDSMACSSCHHDSPTDLADETLSSKVVVHQICWGCHEVGTGANASRSCRFCHSNTHNQPVSTDTGEQAPSS